MQTALECLYGICAHGDEMSEPIYQELTLWGKGDQPERLGRAEIPLEGIETHHNGLQRKTLSYSVMQIHAFSQVMSSQERKIYYIVSNLSHERLRTSANFVYQSGTINLNDSSGS